MELDPASMHQFGKTGMPVSRIGLGTAALGRPGYVNLGHAADVAGRTDVTGLRDLTWSVLGAAWERGIRYFDTARSYGRGEEFLAGWLAARGIGPDEVTIGTKWGYTYTADWRVDAEVHEVKDHSLATLRRQVGESRALLGQHLDLLQVHSATLDSRILGAADVHDELARLRAAGQVRALGLTLSGAGQAETLEQAMAIERDGRRLFDVVQATFNLLEPSLGPMLAAAHEAGMGVIVKEALANGRLVRGDATDRLHSVAQEVAPSRQLDQVGLGFVLAQPWSDVVLSGATTVEQLEQNLGALDLALSASDLDALGALAEPIGEYWQRRAALPWN